MENIDLKNGLKFSFEKLPHTIRLIISKNDEEWVCRKAKLSKLYAFVAINQAHVFNGRLQLMKSENDIIVLVKNENIGIIPVRKFKEALKELE
ncbi:hypothetical protein OC25_21430 [Pedobacter kyungheensis]|uniref:Uncharacterized protein n=1 Tax=Pedobacter kyungheensis TaxID=1069985 RepID=A0A0C1D3A5_9SPHI|nr:hypothetical protein [Pedobacter kyungheensis]KIA91441.1 hypothetical protein OC25_21430 [Pedobacter kyungheensis]